MTESQKRVPGSPFTVEGKEATTEHASSHDVRRRVGDVVEGEVGSARMKEPSHIEPPKPDAELPGNDPVVDLSDQGS